MPAEGVAGSAEGWMSAAERIGSRASSLSIGANGVRVTSRTVKSSTTSTVVGTQRDAVVVSSAVAPVASSIEALTSAAGERLAVVEGDALAQHEFARWCRRSAPSSRRVRA